MSCKHEKTVVTTDKAPKALGPYSVAIKAGPFAYTSGQLGIVPATGKLVEGGIEAQTRQVLENVKNVLEAAGSDLAHVVKTTVFIHDMSEFAKMNAVYGTFFSENPPARSTVQAGLPMGAMVEIETVALLIEHD